MYLADVINTTKHDPECRYKCHEMFLHY
jgi:hypothetical protein